MMGVEKINQSNILEQMQQSFVVLYGAGTTGKKVMNLLNLYQVDIKYIVDDNMNRWGTKVEGIEIISYEKFKNLCDDLKDISVIIATIYGKTILERICNISNIKVYEMYEWLDEIDGLNNGVKQPQKHEIELFRKKSEEIKYKLADEESVRVLEGIYNYICTQNMDILNSICTPRTQYFIPEVLEAIREPLEIVDGGAYIGELFQAIRSYNIPLKHWYCFEADESNYRKLVEQSQRLGLVEKQECIKKGLWDKECTLYFEGEKETSSRIVDYQTDCKLETISLDNFFKKRKCNFIKMDIEGAEYPALCGGIRTIRRDRPILAISIYHSLEDYIRIPDYLMRCLDHYKYYIRHHALIFGETVFYAIPDKDR